MMDFYVNLGIKEINIGHVLPLNKAIKNSKEIIAKMSEVVPFLINCQNKYGDKIKFLFVEYPACVFPEKYRQKEISYRCAEGKYAQDNRRKPVGAKRCWNFRF